MTKGTPSDSTPQDAVLNEAESQTLPRYEITDADGDGDIDFKDAAILAEYDVHGHEETPETAWQHALARIGRIFAGFGLMIAGVVMIFVPGPGLLAFAAGLVILSRDFVWAEKVLRYLQSRVPGLDPDEPIPKKALYMSGVFLLLGAAASIWWFFFGGDEWFDENLRDTLFGWWPF